MRFHLKKTLTWLLSVACFSFLTINFYNRRVWLSTGNSNFWSRNRPWGKNFDIEQEHHKVHHPRMVEFPGRTAAGNVTTVFPVFRSHVTEHPVSVNLKVVWPNKSDYDNDRITNQLKYKPDWLVQKEANKEPIPLKKIVLLSGFGGWQVKRGQSTFLEQECTVNTCDLTDQRSAAQNAAAVISSNSAAKPWTVRPSNQIWILFMLESPYHTPGLSAFANVFNWTATYRHDSDIVAPYEKFVPYNDNVKFLPQNKSYAAGKTKKVAWFVSNCGARNRRREFAADLSKHISVDIYGSCGPLKCPRRDSSCFEKLNKDYKFYLAFENSNCRDYITEKFFVNGLQHDAIPIVMGGAPEDYVRVAPPHSHIHVDDFESPEQLAQYLHKLDQNDDLFNEYFRWKGTGSFINTYFWCRVCAMLHETSREVHSYRNLEKWWRGDGVCIGKDSWRAKTRTSKFIVDDYL